MKRDEAVEEIRRFNRSYLPFMSLMDADYLGTGYSLTEARVLFEVRDRPGCGAADVARALRVDKGYLSRMVRKLEKGGLIERATSNHDGRVRPIFLTDAGATFVDGLTAGGRQLVDSALSQASDAQVHDLARHMREIMSILAELPEGEC